MATTAAARRYALAVFEIAVQHNELDKWRNELALLSRVLSDPAVHGVLESPRVPFSAKQDLVRKAVPGLSPMAMNLAFVLVKTGRISVAARMVELYNGLVDAHRGIVHAKVTTAVPIDDAEKKQVTQWLGQYTGKQVVLDAQTDAQLLGGLVVRMGDKLIDASVRTQLERLKRNLLKAGSGA